MACPICNGSGYIVADGLTTVCLECDHEVIDSRTGEAVVSYRSSREHICRLFRCRDDELLSSTFVPSERKPYPKHEDRIDLHRSRPLPVIPNETVVQLDSHERCPFCGTAPLVEEQMHGHYVCMTCHTITTGCCDGESG